jgi:hypothetical protein
MTEEENIENMKRCPKFESCSIPKCPLDKDMAERVELPEDEQCQLRRVTEKKHKLRMTGILSAKMRGMSKLVCEKNKN